MKTEPKIKGEVARFVRMAAAAEMSTRGMKSYIKEFFDVDVSHVAIVLWAERRNIKLLTADERRARTRVLKACQPASGLNRTFG